MVTQSEAITGMQENAKGIPEQQTLEHGQGIRMERAVTILCPAETLYQFWRNLSNLPCFMYPVESVEVRDPIHSHWTVKGPAGTTVEWDAEVINDQPNEL